MNISGLPNNKRDVLIKIKNIDRWFRAYVDYNHPMTIKGQYATCYFKISCHPTNVPVLIDEIEAWSEMELITSDFERMLNPVDYGTKENPKLMLIAPRYGYIAPPLWIEAYQNPIIDDEINLIEHNGQSCIMKSRVLKVIDLPNKEL